MTDVIETKVEDIEDNSENLDKGFTQADVDKIVRDRLQRAKKDAEKAILEAQKESEGHRTTIETYEGQLKSIIEKQIADVPESVLDLFNKLSILEQLEWLSKHGNEMKSFDKQTIPTTPRGKDGEKKFTPNTKNIFKI